MHALWGHEAPHHLRAAHRTRAFALYKSRGQLARAAPGRKRHEHVEGGVPLQHHRADARNVLLLQHRGAHKGRIRHGADARRGRGKQRGCVTRNRRFGSIGRALQHPVVRQLRFKHLVRLAQVPRGNDAGGVVQRIGKVMRGKGPPQQTAVVRLRAQQR